jgi:hypothetical protein
MFVVLVALALILAGADGGGKVGTAVGLAWVVALSLDEGFPHSSE